MLISKFLNHNIQNHVTDMEEKYGIIFPSQYKDFLCKYNGGYTPKTTFKAGKISSDIRGFYGVGEVGLSLDEIAPEEWLDKNVFPIACDSFGNYIVIGLRNDSSGKIYFCDHEKGYEIAFVAKDLIKFIKCCKSDKISEAATRSIEEREKALIARGRGHIITDDLRQMWQAEIDKYSNMVQEEVIF